MCSVQVKRQREVLAEAHERSTAELRERLLLERERAVEREREMASVRLREQSERFDQQLQVPTTSIQYRDLLLFKIAI